MATTTDVKAAIDLKDITIKSISGISLYWLITKTLSLRSDYADYLNVGLAGAGGLTIVAPILQNLIDGKDLMTGITFDTLMLKNALIDGGMSMAVYLALRFAFGNKLDTSVLNRYVGVICSVIGGDMIRPFILSKF